MNNKQNRSNMKKKNPYLPIIILKLLENIYLFLSY